MWIDKIEVVKWYITGGTASELEIVTPKTAYNNTKGKDPTGDYPAPQATSTAKIGLMYTYDYGFASSKENWNLKLFSNEEDKEYISNANIQNNWLFSGVTERTILRYSLSEHIVFCIFNDGRVDGCSVDGALGVRPTFYLKEDEPL